MALKLDTSARLSVLEKMYLPQILQALWITFKHIFRKKVTVLVAKPLEITKEVLLLLDKKLPKVKVAEPGR